MTTPTVLERMAAAFCCPNSPCTHDCEVAKDYLPHAKAALQTLLEDLPESVVDAARAAGPIVLVEREEGAPYPRCMLAAEATITLRAFIQAIMDEKP